jgi:polysaccharide biosynthesis transport protein
VALAFVRESMDNTVRTPDDMHAWIGKPALAMLPKIKPEVVSTSLETDDSLLSRDSPAMGRKITHLFQIRPRSPEAEAIRDLRTALLFSNPVAAPRVILVSSPSAGEGKTTVSINLALALAHSGKTCLIDGDLRQPRAAHGLGVDSKIGLAEVLSGRIALSQALMRNPDVPMFAVLPAGELVPNPGDLIDVEQMQEVVDCLKESFAYVVIDSPPLIPFADARLLASVSDAIVLVGRYGMTTRRALTRCASILEQVRGRVAGVVLNDIDLHSADYHYYNYGFSSNKHSDTAYYYNESITGDRDDHPTEDEPPRVRRKSAGA